MKAPRPFPPPAPEPQRPPFLNACPVCTGELIGVSDDPTPRQPVPGAPVVCSLCRYCFTFTENGQPREFTDAEVFEMCREAVLRIVDVAPDPQPSERALYASMTTQELKELRWCFELDMKHVTRPEGIAFGRGRLDLIAEILKAREDAPALIQADA